jgi:D-alanyl-D-alanine carboxypeptidase (penicillin-binding protein 5/6)
LMTYGFRFFETHKLYNASTPLLQVRTWQGEKAETPLGILDDFYVTIPTGQYKRIQTSIELDNPLKAPIAKGKTYGTVKVMLNNQVVSSKPLIALDNNPSGNVWRRAADSVRFNIHKYFSEPNEKVNTG